MASYSALCSPFPPFYSSRLMLRCGQDDHDYELSRTQVELALETETISSGSYSLIHSSIHSTNILSTVPGTRKIELKKAKHQST